MQQASVHSVATVQGERHTALAMRAIFGYKIGQIGTKWDKSGTFF